MARVLITGGTGFIGSHLARACLRRGDTVGILARPGSDTRRLAAIRSQITLLRARTDNADEVSDAFAQLRPQTIFHLGNTNRFPSAETATAAMHTACALNLLPFLMLLDAAARLRSPPATFVRAGTIAEYGEGATLFSESNREAPRSAYGWAALAVTRAMDTLAGGLPFAMVTARLALTYGPAQSDEFLVPRLIRQCLRGVPETVLRPGDRRDLVHVDDVVAGLLRLAELPTAAGPVVNLSSGHAPAMRDVAALITRLTGAPPGLVACAEQPGPATELRADPSLAWQTLGWQAVTPLELGLSNTIEWERRQMARGATAKMASITTRKMATEKAATT